MAGHLLLGPVLFRDYELPEQINWGGDQRLVVHRMPGGGRVVDAMGRDDAAIAWTGAFSGEDGPMRARVLDLMRAEGGVWPLSWGSFLYSVVVARFSVSYERANWLPYRIVCAVLRDEIEGVAEEAWSLASELLGDIGMVGSAGAGLDTGTAQTALAALGVEGAVARGGASYGAALAAVGDLAGGADAALAMADRGIPSGGPQDAAGLGQASTAAETLARVAQARGYARRAMVNLGNADS